MVQRSPSPAHVRDKRWVRGLVVAVIVTAIAVKMEMYVRSTTDWTVVQQDSIFWQAMDGLFMKADAVQTANAVMQELADGNVLVGKRVFVTGGNRGLGREIAVQCAALGAHVVFTARTPRQDVLDSMRADVRLQDFKAASTGTVTMIKLDLSDLDEVDHAVNSIIASQNQEPFDVVILNAGVAPQTNQTTAQGIELALGVNCVGHHYLTERLLEHNLVKERIIIVTSETFRAAAPLDVQRLFEPVQYSLAEALTFYARSKLAVNTVSNELVRRHNKDLHIHLICPGPVATNLANQAPDWIKPAIDVVMQVLFQTPTAAARPVIVLAGAKEFGETTGRYFHMHKEKPQRADATDTDLGKALWTRVEQEIAARRAAPSA